MANGRLGKAKVTSKETAEIYKNTSGAEASVSVVAQSTSGTAFYLHLDDGTDALTTTTTLATEAYNERYVDYSATNTNLTDPAPTYQSRFSFYDTTTPANFDTQFEAYVNSNTTTYSFSTQTEYYMTSNTFMPYESWKNVRSGATVMVAVGNASFSTAVAWDGSIDDVSEEEYYNRVINGDTTDSSTNRQPSYYNCGLVVDPWAGDKLLALGLNDNGYMTGLVRKDPGTSFGSRNESSGSWFYQVVATSISTPSSTYNYRYLHLQKDVVLGEGVGNQNRFAISLSGDGYHDSDQASSTMAQAVVNESQRKVLRWSLGGSSRTGGQVVYFQYNPSDGLHYVCYYNEGNTTMYLATLNASTAVETISNNTTINMSAGGDEGEGYGLFDITGALSLTVASPFAFPTSGDNTARCTFIGTTTSPLWALVFSRYNDTTASQTYYSTDLKTWQRSTDYFGSVDYLKVSGDTTITSNGGVVSAERSNIANVGDDGVLENNTSFIQYERTGLVLSNNDRVVVYNSGSKDCVVQVMGYEGE
jgi:hypothetical protein